MKKRLFPKIRILSISVLAMVLFAGPLFAGGSAESGKAAGKETIGIAKIVSHPALDAIEQGIQDELASLGYDFTYDLQNANGEISTAASIANKFRSEGVKVAIGIATPTAQALANGVDNAPVVYSAVTDPVAAGLVASFDKGGDNVTGVSDMTPVETQITLLNRMKPIRRLGHVYSSGETNAVVLANMAKETARKMGIEFVEATVTNSSEVRQATQTLVGRVDAIYISNDNTVVSALNAVAEVAGKAGIPIMSADPSSAETIEVLAALGHDYYRMGRETGKLVAELLGGKSPADIPTRFMTAPEDMDLVINLDVAKKLGITVPRDIIDSADKIVENGALRK